MGILQWRHFSPRPRRRLPRRYTYGTQLMEPEDECNQEKMVKDEINAKGTGALNLHFMDEWLVRLLNATTEVDNLKEVANALDSKEPLNTRKPPIRRPSTVSDHIVLIPLIAGSRKPQKAKISMANSSIR